MKKILSVVGARPEFIQCVALRAAFDGVFEETLVHTGQHFDYSLSGLHFKDLPLAVPDIHLGVEPTSFGTQLGHMVEGLTGVIRDKSPDLMIIRGDTNSTLAGALAGARSGVPLVHIESGERSFDLNQPEEQARIVADHLSSTLFCVNEKAKENLKREGITKSIFVVGDVMYDAFKLYLSSALKSVLLKDLRLTSGEYAVLTVHRAENTDNPQRLRNILGAFKGCEVPIVFPVHPRTRKVIEAQKIEVPIEVKMIEPIGYLDMLALIVGSKIVVTDSGGVQREAYFAKRPCLTCRSKTEWMETVNSGWNKLVNDETEVIKSLLKGFPLPEEHPEFFGQGNAAYLIRDALA